MSHLDKVDAALELKPGGSPDRLRTLGISLNMSSEAFRTIAVLPFVSMSDDVEFSCTAVHYVLRAGARLGLGRTHGTNQNALTVRRIATSADLKRYLIAPRSPLTQKLGDMSSLLQSELAAVTLPAGVTCELSTDCFDMMHAPIRDTGQPAKS